MISYAIYTDAGTGVVDYTAPIATTSSLTATISAVPLGATTIYAVRATDTGSGLEEQNTDARVSVVVGPSGIDVTGQPLSPAGLSVIATANSTARVEWGWPHLGTTPPTGFRVYLGGSAVPAATVPYFTGLTAFRCTLALPTEGVASTVNVRAYNAAGEDDNTVTATVTADATPPADVAGLTATPSF